MFDYWDKGKPWFYNTNDVLYHSANRLPLFIQLILFFLVIESIFEVFVFGFNFKLISRILLAGIAFLVWSPKFCDMKNKHRFDFWLVKLFLSLFILILYFFSVF